MTETDWRVPASDQKGHSERLWFRCQPSLAAMCDQVVASRKFPYRTKGDLLRHALNSHLKWLQTQGASCSVAGQVDTVMEVLRDEEYHADFLAVFDKLSERVAAHLAVGAQEEAARLIKVVQKHVASMPEGYWRDRYERTLRERHGQFLEGQRRVANLLKAEVDE